jgi:hypothetical protein
MAPGAWSGLDVLELLEAGWTVLIRYDWPAGTWVTVE